jgi:hypothetical protein
LISITGSVNSSDLLLLPIVDKARNVEITCCTVVRLIDTLLLNSRILHNVSIWIGLQNSVVAFLSINTVLYCVSTLDSWQESVVELLLLQNELLFGDVGANSTVIVLISLSHFFNMLLLLVCSVSIAFLLGSTWVSLTALVLHLGLIPCLVQTLAIW